jgi:hypothetical protein
VQKLQFWCGQFEIAPETEILHVHIYVEFKNTHRIRWNTIKNTIFNVTNKHGNIQVPRRTSNKQRACAVNYVLKPDGIAPETEPFIWEYNCANLAYNPNLRNKKKQKQQTKDEKVEIQVNWIESKPKHWTWDQIVHESKESKLLFATCSWGAKYHSGRMSENQRRTIKNVIIFYGAGGTGKTTMAQNYDIQPNESKYERYYKRNTDDGKFWGGGRTAYNGQRIIHLEEFCGQETAANFKEICDLDKHGASVNIKNSGIDLNHETVIITSNHHPAAWYKNLCKTDKKQWIPLCRRFTQVFFFPETKPDGEFNHPTATDQPYYIDQTDDFKNMDYDTACEHAATHWPLPVQESIIF